MDGPQCKSISGKLPVKISKGSSSGKGHFHIWRILREAWENLSVVQPKRYHPHGERGVPLPMQFVMIAE